MIYRILVDNRLHVSRIGPRVAVTRYALRALSRGSEPDLPARLAPLRDKVFRDHASFVDVLSGILGRKRLALHGRLISLLVSGAVPEDPGEARAAVPRRDQRDRRLGGPGYGWLADVMTEHGLRAPRTTNSRLRYYFTERGWRTVGRHVAAEARRLGHDVRIVRQKNPAASQVLYRDEFQMAILQGRRPSCGRASDHRR